MWIHVHHGNNQKLTQDPSTGKLLGDADDDDEKDVELTDEQEESYAEFARSAYDALLRDVDRRGYEHNITFSSQDDAWSMCWRERTGIPLHSSENVGISCKTGE